MQVFGGYRNGDSETVVFEEIGTKISFDIV